ncbi:hypothetical protein ACET9D_17650 [Aeromonas veronii]
MEGFWRVKDTYYRKAANVRLRFFNLTYGPMGRKIHQHHHEKHMQQHEEIVNNELKPDL